MPELQYMIDAKDVPEGQVKAVQVGESWYVVCNEAGAFHVTDITCPHQGSPLSGGDVRRGCLLCPVHRWPWDLKTGLTSPDNPTLRLGIYRCEMRDGKVYADVSAPVPLDPSAVDPFANPDE
jgi:nitrite reductase/ring-hydroxylating ferredoxin subunit